MSEYPSKYHCLKHYNNPQPETCADCKMIAHIESLQEENLRLRLYNEAPEEGHFDGADHPIIQLAQDRDDSHARIKELEEQVKELEQSYASLRRYVGEKTTDAFDNDVDWQGLPMPQNWKDQEQRIEELERA